MSEIKTYRVNAAEGVKIAGIDFVDKDIVKVDPEELEAKDLISREKLVPFVAPEATANAGGAQTTAPSDEDKEEGVEEDEEETPAA